MAESWKAVATALAVRLNHSAPHCTPPREDCPFCEDYRAYQRYVAKVKATGGSIYDPLEGAVEVPLHEVSPNWGFVPPRREGHVSMTD